MRPGRKASNADRLLVQRALRPSLLLVLSMPEQTSNPDPIPLRRWGGQGAWHALYNTSKWKRLRVLQLTAHPLCKLCLERGTPTVATVVDHVVPHRGDRTLFFLGELQSLCEPCHNIEKKREEMHGFRPGVDADGWPTDPRHPANASPQARRSRA